MVVTGTGSVFLGSIPGSVTKVEMWKSVVRRSKSMRGMLGRSGRFIAAKILGPAYMSSPRIQKKPSWRFMAKRKETLMKHFQDDVASMPESFTECFICWGGGR